MANVSLVTISQLDACNQRKTLELHAMYFSWQARTENGRSLCGLCFDSPVVAFIVIDQMYLL